MSYFTDLSECRFGPARTRARNVGWLDVAHPFARKRAEDDVLERVWQHTAIAIAESRGYHPCALCGLPGPVIAERHSERRMLGAAQIRVFGSTDEIFAAPNLIYHYMAVHDYDPPAAFLDALSNGLSPESQQYLDRLSALGLQWVPVPTSQEIGRPFRFVKTDTGVKKVFD
jgi:hypothetical protein